MLAKKMVLEKGDCPHFATSVAHEADKQILYLRFQSGEVYRYFGFSAAEYQAFLDAESRGRFFLAHIRGQYRYERMATLHAA